MDNQLEQARDAWVNAFFTGNVELLAHYEDEDFKVIWMNHDNNKSQTQKKALRRVLMIMRMLWRN